MNELVRTLQARIKDLEIELARYENARYINAVEIDHLRRKLGYNNTHPDAEKCGCYTDSQKCPAPSGFKCSATP